jgi:hypothetical protein
MLSAIVQWILDGLNLSLFFKNYKLISKIYFFKIVGWFETERSNVCSHDIRGFFN